MDGQACATRAGEADMSSFERWMHAGSGPRTIGKPSAFDAAGTGFRGWRQRLPERRPAVTPCLDGGRVFVGGGFGSHAFYAFDSRTGARLWERRTRDDGPTAAVCADGHVVFNTESCTVSVLRAETGEPVWEKWLGDPLLAQPAVANGRVSMAYPDRNGEHRLAAFELAHGRELWSVWLPSDVISAPVIAGDAVYCATLDGAVHCLDLDTGRGRWMRELRATSAPWVWRGEVFVSQRAEGKGASDEPLESVHAFGLDCQRVREVLAPKRSEYLRSRRATGRHAQDHAFDAGVGFAAAPAAAKLDQTERLLGTTTVWRTWSFQGSRPCVWDGRVYSITGDELSAADVASGRELWRWRAPERKDGERALTPAAVANGRVHAGSRDGRLRSWDARSGALRWAVPVGAAVAWQPVVSGGWVYAGLANGELVGIATGDALDDGWPMWGGGPGHNGGIEHSAAGVVAETPGARFEEREIA
jgi:Ca-activated chloride channel family protein